MRILIIIALALGAAACSINPVLTNPEPSRSGCRDAARDYCRYVVRAAHEEMESCAARYTYECESGKH